MDLLNAFDRPIAFHRCLAEATGSIKAGLFLSQAIYWTKRSGDTDGWFWKTYEQWHEETMLTRREIDKIRDLLCEFGLLEEKLAGSPAKLNYRLNLATLLQFVQKVQTSLYQKDKLDCTKGTNSARARVEQSETTTETTTRAPSGADDSSFVTKKLKPTLALVLGSIPVDLTLQSSPLFLVAWKSWVENRLQIKPLPTLPAFEQHMKVCARLGPEEAIYQIEVAIGSGWRAIFPRQVRQKQKAEQKDGHKYGPISC